MRVKNASGELVEVGSDAFGLIGCSLGGSSLLELLTLSKDTRKQRRAMLALVSDALQVLVQGPLYHQCSTPRVARESRARDAAFVEKTIRAYSDMVALNAAAHDMNVGKGALCWMLSEFILSIGAP